MQLQLTVPEVSSGHVPVLCIPACAGRLRIGSLGLVLEPSWTERRVLVDRSVASSGSTLELQIEAVDDDPFGGFLPAIEVPPRGLWQGCWWESIEGVGFARRPSLRWQERVLSLRTELLFASDALAESASTAVEIRVDGVPMQAAGPGRWTANDSQGVLAWKPEEPQLQYAEVEILLDGVCVASEKLPIAYSEVRAVGEQLQLNGEAFRVQGLLHWGYYPDLLGPDPAPDALRAEIAEMQARGFNLLKACLWLPPHRFLDVCDEMGMAVWVEYPRWAHPLKGDVAAYRDFIEHDAAHPCVILRTLTCENDAVDAAAVDQVFSWIDGVVPGALVNDNSAWLDCNHRPAFWDEHPYLHAAQWPFYLERTDRALADRPRMPLILGETMAFDALEDDWSREAAVRLRRRQIEQLRAVFPHAGYVACAARDIPQSPLGLQGQDGVWKTPVESWAWQKEALTTPRKPSAAMPWELALGDGKEFGVPERVVALPDLSVTTHPTAKGASYFHHATPRRGAWRCPEHTFWCPVAAFDAVVAEELGDLRDALFEDLMSGRGLLPPPTNQARVLVAARDVHDRAGAEQQQPFLFVAKWQGQPLLVSSLRLDHAPGRAFHRALLERFAVEGEAWVDGLDDLAPIGQQDRLLLEGPWRLWGAGVRGGEQLIRPETMLINAGANAVQGWVDAEAEISVPADWTGPIWLRAEAIGDGFELYINNQRVHIHGRPGYTWDAGRDVPCEIELTEFLRPAGKQTDQASGAPDQAQHWRIRTKDHRGAGAMIGPLSLLRAPEAAWIY